MQPHRLEKQFRDLLQPVFPLNASFSVMPSDHDEIRYRVDWKIPAVGRPNRHSRPIVLRLSSALLEDYESARTNAIRASIDKRMVSHVRARLATFDPEHDFPREAVVPEETWVLGTELIG